MSAIRQAQVDAAFNRVLALANGDPELLARKLLELFLTEQQEDDKRFARSQAHGFQSTPKRGAPKGKSNPLPHDMKRFHAERALTRMRRHGWHSNKDGALFELIANNVSVHELGFDEFDHLLSNLQKRISELKSRS